MSANDLQASAVAAMLESHRRTRLDLERAIASSDHEPARRFMQLILHRVDSHISNLESLSPPEGGAGLST
jgi:hypothetical protein